MNTLCSKVPLTYGLVAWRIKTDIEYGMIGFAGFDIPEMVKVSQDVGVNELLVNAKARAATHVSVNGSHSVIFPAARQTSSQSSAAFTKY